MCWSQLKKLFGPLRKFFPPLSVPTWKKEHQPNEVYCKMMEHERWAKYFATCNTTGCFSELIKIAQFYFSFMAHYANVERLFPWCSHKNKGKRNLSNWTSFYSI